MKDWSEGRKGLAATLLASLLWGAFPLYFRLLAQVPALETLCHRIVWGMAFALSFLLFLRGPILLIGILRNGKTILALSASAAAIAANWGIYIWAVTNDRTLDVSLGYFLSPLMTLALGAVFFKERLTLRQSAAIALMVAGVACLAVAKGGLPWIALFLPASFALYGLIRKVTNIDALSGFLIETLLMLPFALLWLLTRENGGAFVTDGYDVRLLLILAGPITAAPIILFSYGARRTRLSTLGLTQYISPTIQMMLAVFLFGENFTTAHAAAYGAVWLGLFIYAFPGHRRP